MRLDKRHFLWTWAAIILVGFLLVLTVGSKDSEENQLERRLAAFLNSLPPDARTAFQEGRYDEATRLLETRLRAYRSFLPKIPETNRTAWLKAEFDAAPPDVLSQVPKDLLDFYKHYYKVIDFECIQTFTEAEVVDFFKTYFVERLAQIKAKRRR